MFQDFKNNCPEKDFRVVLKVQDDKCLEMDEEICSIKCKNMWELFNLPNEDRSVDVNVLEMSYLWKGGQPINKNSIKTK